MKIEDERDAEIERLKSMLNQRTLPVGAVANICEAGCE